MWKRKHAGGKQSEGMNDQSKDDVNNSGLVDGVDGDIFVNMSYLKPVKTLVIELDMNGEKMKSLIDTGASVSLIRESVCKVINKKPLVGTSSKVYGLQN